MSMLCADFSKSMGKVKPMHATNNGPVVNLNKYRNGTCHPFNCNLKEFAAAGIPYARTHDTSHYHRYGLEHTVDVYYIFPDFDADPTDPKNYDFACTDHYLQGCLLANTKPFFRLGHRIEHEVKKYGIHPPKDFKKWAVICEHIIRHYNEGWADGFHMGIEYWEIWNEPDLHWNTDIDSPTWSGTPEQFFELYDVTATHLKASFPHLKIGGPALAGDLTWAEMFLAQLQAPLDFFSWHRYDHDIEHMLGRIEKIHALMNKYGFGHAESILNEWNYVKDWQGDDMVYSHRHRGKIKGAAYTAAVMSAVQYTDVDMLMYYDARPNEFWNGMFDVTVVGEVLKGYYPFVMFNTLYRLGECAAVQNGDHGYLCAAKNEREAAVMFTHYNDDDATEPKEFTIDLSGFGCEVGTEIEVYLLDDTHDLTKQETLTYYGDRFGITLTVPNNTCYLFKLRKKD